MIDLMQLVFCIARLVAGLLLLPGDFDHTWACWTEPATNAAVCEYDQPDQPYVIIRIEERTPQP